MDPFTGEIEEVSRSVQELCLDWRIPRFLDLPCGWYDCYDSDRFLFSGALWCLRVWPNWESSGRVYHVLHRVDVPGPSTRTVIVKVGVRTSGGGVEWREEKERKFGKGECLRFGGSYTRSEFRDRLMTDDTLTVRCQMKVHGSTARGVTNGDEDEISKGLLSCECSEDEADGNSSKRRKTSEQQNLEGNAGKSILKAMEDFGKLLSTADNSDVTVQVGDVEIRVHSTILFARCPALSTPLRHESVERASKRIVVENCEPDTFRDFLHFLYTGSVRSLTKDNTFALYRIADRYLLDDLKQLCLEHVQNTMSVHTFCDAVRLAMMHGENGLMERANAFATQNTWSILHSEEWQNFNLECPAEANEVLLNLGPYPEH